MRGEGYVESTGGPSGHVLDQKKDFQHESASLYALLNLAFALRHIADFSLFPTSTDHK